MADLQKKLQKERTIEGKCKYVHKYFRFAGHNKTYRTDVYYCALCGHKVKIEEIVGKFTTCWKCGQAFSVPVAMLKLKPTCFDCTHKKAISYLKPEGTNWIEGQDKAEAIDKDDVIAEIFRKAGIQ